MTRPHSLWLLLAFILALLTTLHHSASAEVPQVNFQVGEDGEEMMDEPSKMGSGEEMFNMNDGHAAEDQEVQPETSSTTPPPPVKVETVRYQKPSTEGLEFAETFDGDIFSRWIKSKTEKFSGNWEQTTRKTEAIVGDQGLLVVNEALHHAISTKLPHPMAHNQGKSVVLSYEAKFEDGLQCGGAYLKLFSTTNLDSQGKDMSQFDNDTPYVVMFGPDRCGSTNKVHLIIKQFNPVSLKWVEHHLADAPRTPFGPGTHVYTMHIKPDNTYEVLVDGKVEKSGDMQKDFLPPFTPPTEIDDPTDIKPEDWVDDAQIPDPDAVKPDDWDEEAPRKIPDPNSVLPDGWLIEEPSLIADTQASQPDSWNAEEDGEWTPPMVPNPKCADAPGCGEWTAPMVPNPDYKGKWFAPLIKNPKFIGAWKPRQIPNPEYFVSENPHALADFDAVGFELWTMQKGLLFDNIVIARSMDLVTAFVEQTWKIRSPIEASQEKLQTPKEEQDVTRQKTTMLDDTTAKLMLLAQERPMLFVAGAVSVLFVVISLIKMLKPARQTPGPAESKGERKSDASPTASRKKSGGKSSSDQTETDSGEEASEEKESSEVLPEKKVVEQQARQRRTKKD